jgi:uncharacterized protein YbaP (TraB family)
MNMRFSFLSFRLIIAVILMALGQVAHARAKDRYPSLLWEITGNGLQQPSYLFGTMHISNKMVFNLNDSFYSAIKNVDAVAIELDPEYWQQEIPRVGRQGAAYRYYTSTYYTDFLTERSYTEGDFTDQLKEVLRAEPELNDALLYRNESSIDNFQEDTYLDLYIYQTGKKLGKQTTGVETFVEAQRMMVEAYIDMANDKTRKNNNEASGRYADLGQQLQDAYRRGDLDMLDSLNTLTEQSPLFTRKFLYDRNVIQAHSIDSIVKTKSLFAGVGAAHLPGKEGVIALLRAKGYKLRPVYMQNRNAEQKEFIDSLTVPVYFRRQFASDSFYSVSVPGKLNDIDNNDDFSKVYYADMGNGSYYLVSRVKTNILFNGYEEQKQLHLVDSLLYENIPGKILAKKEIRKDGYRGLDILNRTRKGDVQRYQIYVTPAELLIFKMGGKGKYVYGPESDSFFNSIEMRKQAVTADWSLFYPPAGGFTIRMPDMPRSFYALKGPDNLPVWKYETVDPSTGNVYGVFKKSIYSFDFIEQDTFDLSLMEESFCSAAFVDKKLSRTLSEHKGRPVVDVTLLAKTGDYVKARFLLQGPHYYMLAVRTKDKSFNPAPFFNSFDITAYRYPQAVAYADTNLKFKVQTPVFPAMDKDIMDMLMYVKKNDPGQKAGAEVRMPEHGHANFISEATGEVVVVNSYLYPRYFYVKDSALFYRNLLVPDSTLIVATKEYLSKGDTKGVLLYLRDTGSTRMIKKLMLVQGHHILTLATVLDSAIPESAFINTFYKTFSMQGDKPAPSLSDNKFKVFFKDYYSSDSLDRKTARASIRSVNFGKEGYPEIKKALQGLNRKDKDYYDVKTAFIAELGYCRDTAIRDEVTEILHDIYNATADTALFQNAALNALSMLEYGKATILFRDLLLQDPPAFEDQFEYYDLFRVYQDSLKLATQLYPELLNLTMIEEYKQPVRSLLVDLLDSNYVRPDLYESYVGNIYFDAKLAFKKLQNSSERNNFSDDEEAESSDNNRNFQGIDTLNNDLYYHEALLMPFYDKNQNLPVFFHKLLQSNNRLLRLNTALLMLRYNRPVADSIWHTLAADDQYRSYLYSRLQRVGRQALFPARYKSKELLSASMMNAYMGNRLDSLSLLQQKEMYYKGQKRNVYFYKYRTRKDGEWKIAINSLLLNKNKEVVSDGSLFMISEKPLLSDLPVSGQLELQLKRLIISNQESGRAFYGRDISN